MAPFEAPTIEELVKRSVNLQVYQQLAKVADEQKAHPAVLAFWRYLLLCFETPRPSTDYCEPDTFSRLDKIRQAVKKAAERFGAEVTQDTAGNLIIRSEGRGAGADKPWLCLQGHLDMVVSQNEGVGHDFENDPIDVRFSSEDGIPDGWLKPLKATTLGADNGVAIAACLAMLETIDDLPPLEMLFTSNEETNFHGAENLRPGTLKSQRLLNLDSEDEYSVIVGSAGIFEHHYKLPVERGEKSSSGLSPVSVKLSGLHGGHSGVDIHKGYGNANKLLCRLMLSVSKPGDDVRLLELSGGSGPTAIPREAQCVVLVPQDSVASFCDELTARFDDLQKELRALEPTVDLKLAACSQGAPDLVGKTTMEDAQSRMDASGDGGDAAVPPPPVPPPGMTRPRKFPKTTKKIVLASFDCSRCERCVAMGIASGADLGVAENTAQKIRRLNLPALTPASTRKVWQFCTSIHSGVLRMSDELEGLTESSVNFGVATLLEEKLFCHLCVRSSYETFLHAYQQALSSFGTLAGAINVENICPGAPWTPCLDSPLLDVLKRTHIELFEGREPHVTATHGGLEPGVLMESHPGLDCCSIGPDVRNPHSPDERISIASGERFVLWLMRTLETLARSG